MAFHESSSMEVEIDRAMIQRSRSGMRGSVIRMTTSFRSTDGCVGSTGLAVGRKIRIERLHCLDGRRHDRKAPAYL
jgi:hypothetical protein